METTLIASGVGAAAGLLAWHRCRRIPGNRPVAAGLLVPLGAGLGAAATHAASPGTTVVLLHLILAVLPLAAVDALTGKLPRRQVLATYPTTALVVCVATVHDAANFLGPALGAALLWAFFLALAHLGGLGAGDVRLAPVLGAHLGYAGLVAVAAGTAAAFTLGGATVAVLVAVRRLGPERRVPFAPALLGGALIALLP